MKLLSFLMLISAFLCSIPCAGLAETSQKSQGLEENVSVTEDLMREHGILNRLLLIYEEVARRIDNHESFDIESLANSAKILRNFIEGYHEKLEEKFIFPNFEKARRQIELVKTLREQHQAGRALTDYILSHSKAESLKEDIQKLLLSDYLKLYVRMFRPHEAREDTILFPEFKQLISKEEYNRLAGIFEDIEHQMFGENGFEKMIKNVEEIEKKLGIYNLNEFTPKMQ